MDVKGCELFYGAVDSSEWEKLEPDRLLRSTGGCVPANECVVRPLSSSSLSWSDSHFSEEPDRMFKSLEMDRSTVVSDSLDDCQRHHHSLSDMELRGGHASAVTSRTMPSLHTTDKSNDDDDDDYDDDDDIESMKNKFLSVWTNAKNGWILKTTTSFKHDSPIWMLGHRYVCTKSESSSKKKDRVMANKTPTSFDEFKLDFRSRIWLTYRTELPTLPGSHLKSDVGWGCMLRCGQMMLAQGLLVHMMHRDWQWQPGNDESEALHRLIIKYFGDTASPASPFSIQKLVAIGHESGRKAGDWYGPASIAFSLRTALEQHQSECPDSCLSSLAIYIARDGVVYVGDIEDECCGCSLEVDESNAANCIKQDKTRPHHPHPELPREQWTGDEPQLWLQNGHLDLEAGHMEQQSSLTQPAGLQHCAVCEKWRAVIVIIPMRLGGESVNAAYVPYLKTLLNMPQCIGIIGGKPKHSVYFIGWQDDKLIYLDPHCCQEFVDVHVPDFPLQTFHCHSPRKMSFSKMDPSCAIAFYCKTRSDLNKFLHEVHKIMLLPVKQHYAMFDIELGRQADMDLSHGQLTDIAVSCDSGRAVHSRHSRKTQHSDDFTLL